MAIIHETPHFIVESHEQPFIDYEEGGHIRIRIKDEFKNEITDRTKLSPSQAIEYIRLSMIVGEALEKVMNQFNIPVIKINYQEMGNRYAKKPGEKPFLHEHIFGRASNATKQPRPESMILPARESGFYKDFRPLLSEHTESIKKEINQLFSTEKYQNKEWHLSS